MTKLNLKQTNLLEILIALNAWELEEKTELQTQSGRSLYFQLAQAMLASESAGGVSLKRRVGTACERSIRERIRTFQQAELLCVKGNDKDARTKQIVPTKKFAEDLAKHLDHCIELLESQFILIEKRREDCARNC